MFCHYTINAAARMRVRLFDPVFVPVTGVAQGSVTATLMKPGGTTQVLTAAAGTNGFTWTEITAGAFSGKGFYQILLTSDLFAAAGEYTVAVSGGTGGAVAEFAVWEALPADVLTRIGSPAVSVTADIAAVAATASLARKMVTNKAEQVANQYKVYDDDGITVLKTFDTKDATGATTNTQVYRRIPA